jgi:tetratricopeptide (TPR) repeat protein
MERDISPARVREILSLSEDQTAGNRLVLLAAQARMEEAFTQRGLAAQQEAVELRSQLESGGIAGINEYDTAVIGFVDAAWERFLTVPDQVIGRVREFWSQGEDGNESLDEVAYRAHLRAQNEVSVNGFAVPETCFLVARALAAAGASTEEVYQVFRRSGDRWSRDQREAGRRVAAVLISVAIRRVYAMGQFAEIAQHRPSIPAFLLDGAPELADALRTFETEAEARACAQVMEDTERRAAHLGYWVEHSGEDLSGTLHPFLRQLQKEEAGAETGKGAESSVAAETRRLLVDLAVRLLDADVPLSDIRRQFTMGEAQFADPILVDIFAGRVRTQMSEQRLAAVIPCRQMAGELKGAGIAGADRIAKFVEAEAVRLTDALLGDPAALRSTVADLWRDRETRQGELDVLLQRVFSDPRPEAEKDSGGLKVQPMVLAVAEAMLGESEIMLWEEASQASLRQVNDAFSRNRGGVGGRTAVAAVVSRRAGEHIRQMICDGREILVTGKGGEPRRLKTGDIRDFAVGWIRTNCSRPLADTVNRFLLAEAKRCEKEKPQAVRNGAASPAERAQPAEKDIFAKVRWQIARGERAQNIVQALRSLIADPQTTDRTVLFIIDLWEQREDFRPALADLLVERLRSRGSIEILLDRIRRDLLREAQGRRAAAGMEHADIDTTFPATDAMQRACRIHDFFADVLSEREEAREAVGRVFRSVEVEYALPVRLGSVWYVMLADQLGEEESVLGTRLQLMEQAAAEDPRNVGARLLQANFLSRQGRYDESGQVLDEVRELSSHPLASLRIESVRLVNYGNRIRDHFAARQSGETVGDFDLNVVLESIQEVCAGIEQAFVQLLLMVERGQLGINALGQIKIERQVVLQNLQIIGFMFARMHAFRTAILFYSEVVRIDPENAVVAASMLAMMQLELGQFTVALGGLKRVVTHNGSRAQQLMAQIMRTTRKNPSDSDLPRLRREAAGLIASTVILGYWMVEAHLYGGGFDQAMRIIEKDRSRKAALFKAKILALHALLSTGEEVTAKIAEAERWLNEYQTPSPLAVPASVSAERPLEIPGMGTSVISSIGLSSFSTAGAAESEPVSGHAAVREPLSTQDKLLSGEEYYVRSILHRVRSRLPGVDTVGELRRAVAEAEQAIRFLEGDFALEYYAIEARAERVYLLTAIAFAAPESEKVALFEAARVDAEQLAKEYPFSPQARRRAVAPLMVLDREQEAMGHLQYIADAGEFWSEDFANVLLISIVPAVQEQAKRILAGWKAQFRARGLNWDEAVGVAKGMIGESNAAWLDQHGEELDQVLASLDSVPAPAAG